MPAGGGFEIGNFALNPNLPEPLLKQAFDCLSYLGYGINMFTFFLHSVQVLREPRLLVFPRQAQEAASS